MNYHQFLWLPLNAQTVQNLFMTWKNYVKNMFIHYAGSSNFIKMILGNLYAFVNLVTYASHISQTYWPPSCDTDSLWCRKILQTNQRKSGLTIRCHNTFKEPVFYEAGIYEYFFSIFTLHYTLLNYRIRSAFPLLTSKSWSTSMTTLAIHLIEQWFWLALWVLLQQSLVPYFDHFKYSE